MRINVMTPNSVGSCRVLYAAPTTGNYNALSPALEILSRANFPDSSLPSGVTVLSQQGACPAGYTRLSAYDGLALVGSTVAGQTGGSTNHVHGAGTLQIPAQNIGVTLGAATDRRWVDDNSGGTDHWVSGENHTHSATGTLQAATVSGSTASALNLPPFRTVLLCEKQ